MERVMSLVNGVTVAPRKRFLGQQQIKTPFDVCLDFTQQYKAIWFVAVLCVAG